MSALPGRCTNELFCTLGASGRLIEVPEGGPFVCPMCGKPLAGPSAPRQDRLRDATLFSMGVSLAVLGAFVGGAFLAVTGIWGGSKVSPAAETVDALSGEAIAPPPPVRHYAMLQAPPALAVQAVNRAKRRWKRPQSEAAPPP